MELDGSGVRLALLGLFLAGAFARSRSVRVARGWSIWLGSLVALGLLAYVAMVRVHPGTGRVHIHHWDVYHYYVGAKYFAELGQDGLYEATVVADFEDDRAGFRPQATIRDLTHERDEVRRAEVVARAAAVKARFATPQRWRRFKSDIALFRAADRERWRSSEVQRDHGYNGTPLTTAILGGLALWSPGGPEAFLECIVWADLLLVLLVGAWLGVRLGWPCGFAFLFFWFANPFNDYAFTGGSFLRYNYFLSLALGIGLLRAGRTAASGVWLALAALFRVFPAAFLLALLAGDASSPARRERLRAHRGLYAAAAATLVVVLAATSFVPTPTGGNPWADQLAIVGTRNAMQAPNGVSLRFPFLYDRSHDVDAVMAAVRRGETLDWLAQTTATFERRLPLYLAALAALVLAGFAFARRTPPLESLFLGVVAIFGAFIVSHYYFCMLTLVPLIFRERTPAMVVLAAGMAVVCATGFVPGLRESLDFRHAVYSVEVLALLVALLALPWLSGDSSLASAAPGASA